MALFGKKKEVKKESAKKVEKVDVSLAQATDRNLSSVIVAPRLTEKTVGLGERNVYTFVVRRDANKYQVRDAVKALYNVTPVKVNIVNKKPAERMVGSRNRTKHVAGMKKAYVYLKKGDTINIV
jgi:large subunit ribosomal protein L23